jgi:hypothetical protein
VPSEAQPDNGLTLHGVPAYREPVARHGRIGCSTNLNNLTTNILTTARREWPFSVPAFAAPRTHETVTLKPVTHKSMEYFQ